MELSKKQIELIIRRSTPFLIQNKHGKLKFPFISVSMQQKVIECLINGIYQELSNLQQSAIISSYCNCAIEDKDRKNFERNLNECRICEKQIKQTN